MKVKCMAFLVIGKKALFSKMSKLLDVPRFSCRLARISPLSYILYTVCAVVK